MGARALGLPLSIAVWQTSLQNVKVKVGSSKNLIGISGDELTKYL